METEPFIRSVEGRRFDFAGDTYTIKRASSESDAVYSMTHAIVAPGSFAPPHTHQRYEEAFYILDGELEFTLGRETFGVGPGDYLRAAPRVRHGFVNKSGRPAQMLFEFTPGGMEELFYEFRTDEGPLDGAAYLHKAQHVHGTVYELPVEAEAAEDASRGPTAI